MALNLMMRTLTILLLLCSLQAISQQDCGTDEYAALLSKKNPSLKATRQLYAQQFEAYKKAAPPSQLGVKQDTIAVVFHIVYKDIQDSFPLSVILTQLAILNQDFNSLNPDISKVPAYFKARIGNMNIKFCLARTDPNGNITSGIVYKKTSKEQTSKFDDFMKFDYLDGSSGWDATKYLNIWVCALKGLNGFSTKPEDIGGALVADGVVISTTAFGIHYRNDPLYNYGRTLTHETGHWLGLKHVFGSNDLSDINSPTCESDDIDDTPPQAVATFGLYSPAFKTPVSCGNGPNGAMWMNYMDYCAHLNRYMFTIGQAQRKDFVISKIRTQLFAAGTWLLPVHRMSNTPAFTSNIFTALAVGADTAIWAGTNLSGFYRYSNGWQKAPVLDNRIINQIVSDKKGGIWIGQAGHEGANATAGGINYFENASFGSHRSYTKSTGLPPRLVMGIYVDTTTSQILPQVWVTAYPQLETILLPNNTTQVVPREGGLYHGLINRSGTPSPYFDTASDATNHLFAEIAGNGHEIWVVDDDVQGVFYVSQILRYDAVTEGPLEPFNYNNTAGIIPPANDIKSIYFDRAGNKWVGLLFDGIAFADQDNNWQSLFFPDIFPNNSSVNQNAITGDEIGNIFIGTTQGLIIYHGTDPADAASYSLLTTADGLPSNNVTALAVDTTRKLLVIGTDNGITYRDYACMFRNCEVELPPIVNSVKNGNWNDPTVWSNGKVPKCGTIVIVFNTVTVTDPAVCMTLFLKESEVKIDPGKVLNFCN